MEDSYFLLVLIIIFFASCNVQADRDEVLQMELKISELESKLEDCNPMLSNQLFHEIFLSTRTEINVDSLILKLKVLDDVPQVNNYSVGVFESLNDKRALSQYRIKLSMSFNSVAEYKDYQNHPIHQKLKSELGASLAAAPASYDYYLE